jgi:hypothetical protein
MSSRRITQLGLGCVASGLVAGLLVGVGQHFREAAARAH